ncbi:MAG: class I SAM-dependent methyltransferase [Alphaproteobacteria bacterium]|nr:class I SAM-dependent methyltransferase [Alphaproteobacteria bacterium]
MSTTHFGFKSVAEEEKSSLVRGVFDSVASRYDLMNDLMSAGIHRLWKHELVSMLSPTAGMHVLDVAGGTGDIAFRILNSSPCLRGEAGRGELYTRDSKNHPHPTHHPHPTPPPQAGEGKIVVADINQQMLEEGKARAVDRNLISGLEWICCDAETLPFPDHHFDAYTIAFGIRNVTHIDRALAEAHRVLKPGGRFLCLEFSHLPSAPLQKLYDAYSFHVIPAIGKKITGNEEAYRYLVESIRRFPNQENFLAMIRQAGFGAARYRNLSGGIVAIHSGRKL